MSEYEQAAKPQPDEPSGPPLPRIGESTDLSFPDASGRTWSERDFRGKVVIAVLWSARCGPCVRELPEVQRLFERHRRDPSTLVVTLDLDDDPSLPAVKYFLKGHDFTFPVLRAPVLLGRTGIPRTWIIDRRGILREDLRGAGPGWRQDMEHWIAALALLEFGFFSVQGPLKNDSILAGLRVDRLYLRPGCSAVEDHFPDLCPKARGGCGGILDLLDELEEWEE